MKDFIDELIRNRILWATMTSWLLTQSIKVTLGVVRFKRFDFRWFIGAGGMPSSHAATVSALATCIGVGFGFHSAAFAMALIFAFIVMFDAQGVRRTIGVQARMLNNIIDDVYVGKRVEEDRLKELIGHTPVEVITGAAMGILIALLIYR